MIIDNKIKNITIFLLEKKLEKAKNSIFLKLYLVSPYLLSLTDVLIFVIDKLSRFTAPLIKGGCSILFRSSFAASLEINLKSIVSIIKLAMEIVESTQVKGKEQKILVTS